MTEREIEIAAFERGYTAGVTEVLAAAQKGAPNISTAIQCALLVASDRVAEKYPDEFKVEESKPGDDPPDPEYTFYLN